MRTLLFVIALFLLATPLGQAQEMEVPAEVQYALLHKILAFDRNLKARAGSELVIGILYQTAFRSSLSCKDDFVAVMAKSQIDKLVDLPIRHVPIALTDDINLAEAAARNSIDIFYVAPLRAVDLKTITAVSRNRKILTFTGVPAYVEAGLTVGIGTKGENPRVIVNLSAAKAEGVEFSSQLLKLAKVIE